MVDRYWVGGTGTWDAATTTNWSATSGGGGGASAPTSTDNAIFDSSSNATLYTVTINAGAICANWTVAGPASGNVTIAGAGAMSIYGSLSFTATGITRSYTGIITFAATSIGKTITTNGISLASSAIIFNGVGGEWTLGSALISFDFTLTNGSFKTAGFSWTVGSITSSNTNVRSLDFSSSTITFNNNRFEFTTITNLTFNAGTSTLISTYGSTTLFNSGGLTCYNLTKNNTGILGLGGNNTFNTLSTINGGTLNISGSNNISTFTATASGTINITAVNTITNVTITTPNNGSYIFLNLGADLNITGTFTTNGANATRRVQVASTAVGVQRTITATALNLSYVDFQDIIGAVATWTGTSLGDLGNNTNITFTAPKTVYWNLLAGGIWQSSTAWATSSGGTPALANFPIPQDTAIIENTGLTTGNTITVGSISLPNVTITRTNAFTLAFGTSLPSIYGNIILTSATTITGSNLLNFKGRGTQTITSAGVTWSVPLSIAQASGSSVIILDNFTSSAAIATTLINGSLDLNGFIFNVLLFTISAGTKSITFNGGTLAISGVTTTAFNNANPTNFTTVAGSGNGIISMTGATAKTFVGGGSVYAAKLSQDGAGTLTISGNNTFSDITNTVQGTVFIFTSGSTTTFTSGFSIKGVVGTLTTISPSSVTNYIFSKSSGVISTNFLLLTRSTATGGATWYAGANSNDNGNNIGWLFSNAPVVPNYNFFAFF